MPKARITHSLSQTSGFVQAEKWRSKVVLDIEVPNWIKCTVVLRGKDFPDLGGTSLERLIENEASRRPQ